MERLHREVDSEFARRTVLDALSGFHLGLDPQLRVRARKLHLLRGLEGVWRARLVYRCLVRPALRSPQRDLFQTLVWRTD